MDKELPVLTGQRVALRPFMEGDIDDRYIGWLNDPRVVRFSNQRFRHHDRISCLSYLRSFMGTNNYFVNIQRRTDGRSIGTMTAYVAAPHATADVGIMIGEPEAWGHGYGLDAFTLLCDWLLADLSLRKVTAGTAEPNVGMIRIMERYGMHREAVRAAQELIEGREVDVLYYARFRD